MNGKTMMTALKRIFTLLVMLTMLVVSIPVASAETTMSLQIPNGTSWGTWKKVSTRRMSFKFEVKNNSSTKTVRSFDVTYYTCDAYGNQNSPTQTVTLTQKIQPYEEVETGLIYLENPDDVCLVYVALSRVRYTNGTSETDPDLNYAYWIINEEDLMVDPSEIQSNTTSTASTSSSLSDLFNRSTSSSVHLTIPDDSEAILKRVSTKRYAFQFEVKNTHPTKTIMSYDVSYYTCDEYGDQNSSTKTVTLSQKIKAYETVTCPIIYLENAAYVYKAYFGISRVRYTDGTTESISSPEYSGWYWD